MLRAQAQRLPAHSIYTTSICSTSTRCCGASCTRRPSHACRRCRSSAARRFRSSRGELETLYAFPADDWVDVETERAAEVEALARKGLVVVDGSRRSGARRAAASGGVARLERVEPLRGRVPLHDALARRRRDRRRRSAGDLGVADRAIRRALRPAPRAFHELVVPAGPRASARRSRRRPLLHVARAEDDAGVLCGCAPSSSTTSRA